MSETDNSLIFNLAAHFAKRNTKNCGGEKRSGESEGGPRRSRLTATLRGKQKFLLFACPVASRRLCYGARPSVQFWFCRPQGGNQSGFRSKWVLTFSNKHHHTLNNIPLLKYFINTFGFSDVLRTYTKPQRNINSCYTIA